MECITSNNQARQVARDHRRVPFLTKVKDSLKDVDFRKEFKLMSKVKKYLLYSKHKFYKF